MTHKGIRAALVAVVVVGTSFTLNGSAWAGDDPYGPVPVPPSAPSITAQSWFLPAALAAVAIGLTVLLLVALVSNYTESATGRVGRRLSRYSLTPREANAKSGGGVATSAMDLASRVVQQRDLDNTLGTRLEAAGVPLRPAEWLLIHIGAPIVLGLGLLLLSSFNLLNALIGVAIGVIVPFAYLVIKESRRKSAFQAQLPDTLQLMAGSLKAGYSLPQAVDVVVREASEPMTTELNRALVEARLGVPLEDAFDAVAMRMNSVDFAWTVMAIRIQREVGGNLAEVLTNVSSTMRERERLRRQVQVLSAEGRLSAAILVGLPVVFGIYLTLVRPEYVGVLISEPLGIAMLVVGITLLLGGMFWLRKVVTVEV